MICSLRRVRSRECPRQKPLLKTIHSNRFLWIPLLLLSGIYLRAERSAAIIPAEQQIELIIQDFGPRLGITQQVSVSVVPAEARLVSVRSASGTGVVFQISFDSDFIQTLDHRELSAVVAHELGHIWIYTHFPYLQTEDLANQQALRLVSTDDLDRLYEKVRKWKGEKGNLTRVVGPFDFPVDQQQMK